MTIEEALVSTLKYEKKVRDHYLHAAKLTDDEQGEGVFKALADEEQGHVDYLESRLAIWHEQGILKVEEIKSVLPTREWIARGKAKMRKTSLQRDYSSELKMLKDALKLEIAVSDHYRDLVNRMDGEASQLFARFLEIEDGHTAVVQAEIDALENSGFWFDISEFNLEAG